MCRDEGHLTLSIELIRGEVLLFTDALNSSYDRRPTIGSSEAKSLWIHPARGT